MKTLQVAEYHCNYCPEVWILVTDWEPGYHVDELKKIHRVARDVHEKLKHMNPVRYDG